MIFTDWIFPVFLGVVFGLYWFVLKGRELRLSLLLVASLVFYAWWDWRFLGLIGAVILLSWAVGLYAGDAKQARTIRNRAVWIGVSANLVILGVFKYFGFFADSFADVMTAVGLNPDMPTLNIILPVGISFYIFQAISYIVDVRREDLPVEQRLRRVALYVAFFPQLVAGPIVRAASFFPQMEKEKRLTNALFISGLRAFVLGWVYKAGLADNIAPHVDAVYGDIAAYSGEARIAATFAFAAQIYFDFAGYSLMAIGVARWFGYYIPKNFDFPYASTSISEFWRRWHISLSSWLRDYLYISLGGNRGGELATYRNLMATMVLGGLWHGAAWTFVVWGALQGAALIVNRLCGAAYNKLFSGVTAIVGALVLTQLFVVLAWAPFRAETFQDALSVWASFAGLGGSGDLTLPWFVWLAPALAGLDAAFGRKLFERVSRAPIFSQPAMYWGGMGALCSLLFALYPLTPAPFVYFQF